MGKALAGRNIDDDPAAAADYRVVREMHARWAESQGCKVSVRHARDPDGKMVPIAQIEAPNGGVVVEVGTEQWERQAPTTVGRLDRRIGIKSPFPSMPP